MAKMKVAIIGGGASGLTSIKCCLDEGLAPVCFEQEDYIGGMWQFTEDRTKTSSVYRSTVINTSKEMMCFSDFPIPKEFPPYMHNRYVVKYLHLYAEHFHLQKYIRFGCKIQSIQRAEDYHSSGNWTVTYAANKEKKETVEEFGAVMVCTGHHWQPSWPSFKGMDIFKGVQMHSHSYKDFKGFEGKTVVVVGIGNSGGDIAVELSKHAKQVYLSTRRGAWVLSRLSGGGKPFDMAFSTRFTSYFPLSLNKLVIEANCNQRFCHNSYGLRPSHSVTAQHPMINDSLPHQIITGLLVVKPNISQLTVGGVEFDDGSTVENVDTIIFSTGYDMRFPYLEIEEEILHENKVNLYKYVFPPFLKQQTLAVIGNIQPLGAINPISELQARWACGVFVKKLMLPSQKDMESDVHLKRKASEKRYYCSKRHTVQVNFIGYCDELAEMIGCRPNLLKLFITDPLLTLKVLFGSCTPPQYRLMGPGSWTGAKQAIENAPSNVIYATKTRVLKKTPKSMFMKLLQILGILILIIAVFYVFYN